MTHKLYYALTKEIKTEFSKIVPDIHKSIQDMFTAMGASAFTSLVNGQRTLPDGRIIKFKVEKVDSVKIPLKSAEYFGEKSVLLCSEAVYNVLINACKLDNYLRDKDGVEMISFNQFINNLVMPT